MGKWMVVKDQDEDNHDTRSDSSVSSHVHSDGKNKVQAQGINVFVGDSGGIGSAAATVHGVLASQDEVDDNPSTTDLAAARQEAIDAGANPDANPDDQAQGDPKAGVNTPCGTLPSYPNDSYQLSPNFTLGTVSSKCIFPYRVRAQGGLSVPDIVCNLKALSTNILEPLRAHYPNGFRVNSGFRVGSGTSQHLRGQAADIQWSGISNQEYLTRAQWVRANLPFDQIIMEHSSKTRSLWLHISYNRSLSKQRGKVNTMIGGRYPPGLKLYY